MNRYCLRAVRFLIFLICASPILMAQRKGTVSFILSMEQPGNHTYHVEMSYKGGTSEIVDLKMPMWTPGYYRILDFPKNVRNLGAADGTGKPLPWEKITENCWRICSSHASEIRVAYDVVANTPFVANCYLDKTRGYVMPAGMFFYIADGIDRPVTLTIKPYASWTDIATGLDEAPGKKNTFIAPDFNILYDSPILIGNLERLPEFTVRGIAHDFVAYRPGNFDRQEFIKNLKAVIEAGINIIGEVPYRHYTFIAIGPGQGGIEHLNSTSFSFNSDGLSTRAGMIRTLSFLAHEYFHNYNVKRIRPLALGPFDYDKPNLTNMLWVSEGFTVYYEYLMLARAGLMTQKELLEALKKNIAAYENSTGRLFQSATQSSFESWTQGPFVKRGEGIGKTISYYDKGPVLGWLLDLKIRHETQNKRSLDDVMRTLYREFYKDKRRGFTDREFRDVCERIAGTALAEVFEYASTIKEIDYAKYLAYAGIELEQQRELPTPWLGAIVEDAGGDLVIAAVENNSPAQQASLEAQQVIKLLDGVQVNAKQWNEAILARKPGDSIRLTIRSGRTDREITIRLGNRAEQSYQMKVIANPTPSQAMILQGLIRQE